MRSTSAALLSSRSVALRRTRATSSVTRGSGESRMSIIAAPITSIARTSPAGPRVRA